ncbi:MAG: hypothetical protein LBF26_02975 [Puniceicoccales bacterium]|jgi:hypothetical protein|nr:hypothetical protein [Puniceicoccales bacterium]
MNVSGNLPANHGGPRVVEVDETGAGDDVLLCTTVPRIEEPDDQGALAERKGPAGATTEKLSTADYVARNRLILLVGSWPEIKERIVAETNRLRAEGRSFFETHQAVNAMVQAEAPRIQAARDKRKELVRSGAVEPKDDFERWLVADVQKTKEAQAATEAARARADAAEIRAGIKKKAQKDSGESSAESGEKCGVA